MSKEDFDKVFTFLDPNNTGFFTYQEFCKLNQEKKVEKKETGGRTIGELHNNNGHMMIEAQERIKRNLSI